MAHTYESIRELDEEINGGKRLLEMSIEKYMEPRPFRKIGPWGQEEIDETTVGYVCNEREARLSKRWKEPPEIKMLPYEESDVDGDGNIIQMEEYKNGRVGGRYQMGKADRSNRVRVKNVYTGVLFEFSIMSNSARFLGVGHNIMRYGTMYESARVFRVGRDRFVFEYDGVERHSGYCDVEEKVLDGFVEVVWGSGLRERFDSYLSVAIHIGLLIGYIVEEEDRWRGGKLAKRYKVGKKYCTLEFNGESRENDYGKCIVSHWMGLYVGDWEKVRKVTITQGNSQPLQKIESERMNARAWAERFKMGEEEAALFVERICRR